MTNNQTTYSPVSTWVVEKKKKKKIEFIRKEKKGPRTRGEPLSRRSHHHTRLILHDQNKGADVSVHELTQKGRGLHLRVGTVSLTKVEEGGYFTCSILHQRTLASLLLLPFLLFFIVFIVWGTYHIRAAWPRASRAKTPVV